MAYTYVPKDKFKYCYGNALACVRNLDTAWNNTPDPNWAQFWGDLGNSNWSRNNQPQYHSNTPAMDFNTGGFRNVGAAGNKDYARKQAFRLLSPKKNANFTGFVRPNLRGNPCVGFVVDHTNCRKTQYIFKNNANTNSRWWRQGNNDGYSRTSFGRCSFEQLQDCVRANNYSFLNTPTEIMLSFKASDIIAFWYQYDYRLFMNGTYATWTIPDNFNIEMEEFKLRCRLAAYDKMIHFYKTHGRMVPVYRLRWEGHPKLQEYSDIKSHFRAWQKVNNGTILGNNNGIICPNLEQGIEDIDGRYDYYRKRFGDKNNTWSTPQTKGEEIVKNN